MDELKAIQNLPEWLAVVIGAVSWLLIQPLRRLLKW